MYLTVPNVITGLRLLGVPLFAYLLLGPQYDLAALVVLVVGGGSDWVDGWLARRFNQVSRLGAFLDPTVDRLYIVATLLTLTLREIVPWPFTVALLTRELVMAGALVLVRRAGYGALPVHYLGKTATTFLLAAFPTQLLATAVPSTEGWADPVGWALGWWGLVLYWVAAVLYLVQTGRMTRRRKLPAT